MEDEKKPPFELELKMNMKIERSKFKITLEGETTNDVDLFNALLDLTPFGNGFGMPINKNRPTGMGY